VEKFNRNYQLRVQTEEFGPFLEIGLPFTVEFDITRNTLTSQNVCQIRVYNLSDINRNQLRYNASNYGQHRAVELKAGYGNNLATIFSGNISQMWSVREGVDFITQIECFDGGFAFVNGETNLTFPAGTPVKTVIGSLMATLPNVKVGSIGNYPGVLARGNTYSGNTVEILTQLTGGGFFIDNGTAYALGTNEYVEELNATIEIDASTGLLNTPVLEDTIARFEMLFEPSLNIGRKVRINSRTETNFNGEYKVTAVKHRGTISGAVCGNATTVAQFIFFKLLVPVK